MPNKTLTVNLDPTIEAKLSGFFDGLTANLRIVKEEYERVLCLFQQANKAKRMERQMRIDAQEANWEATKYIAAIGRVIGNDRDPNQLETAAQVIERIINERDLWKKRADALLEIAKASDAAVTKPYQLFESRGGSGSYLVNKKDFEELQRQVEAYKHLSQEEGWGGTVYALIAKN